MKGSEMIKEAIGSDMPDIELVQKKCMEELHKVGERSEKANKINRKMRRSIIYAGLGICAVIWLCVLNLPASSNAESFIARLQTWLHLDHERVAVGEMEKSSIRIPEDCEEVEYEGEKYLTKSYASVEELEEDIGKHLDVWRGVEEFDEGDILLRIVDGEYARVSLVYDLSRAKEKESVEREDKIQDLEFYITIPLSTDFSMNTIKLKNQVLKDAILDEEGNLVSYGRNGDYSNLETYYSPHLDINVSVIEKKEMENIDKKQDFNTGYYFLYFVHRGLSYQINCNSNIATAKSIVEELE